jgi:gas vesicle protein
MPDTESDNKEHEQTYQEGFKMAANRGEKFVWMLAGVGLGAGIALLFAPYTGREVRRRLTRLAEDSREKLTEGGQEILDKSKQVIERGRAVVDEALDFVERGRRVLR